MRLGKFQKTPDEVKKYSIEYHHWLDQGEYLASISLSPVDPTDDEMSFVLDTLGANDTKITFFASNGVAGKTYEISATATTTQGQVKQDVILFVIRDLQ